jgi:hypothetical protein
MKDPKVQVEIFNLGLEMEKPSAACPKELDKARTLTLVMESNEFAFELFKKQYLVDMDPMNEDMMLVPVLISKFAHDFVTINYEYAEEVFRAALFKHKVFENSDIANHMQKK